MEASGAFKGAGRRARRKRRIARHAAARAWQSCWRVHRQQREPDSRFGAETLVTRPTFRVWAHQRLLRSRSVPFLAAPGVVERVSYGQGRSNAGTDIQWPLIGRRMQEQTWCG